MADSPRGHDAPHSSDWDLLARHLAGESDPAERARIERLLAERPDHAALLGALDAAFRVRGPEPLSTAEVDAALAAVMARRGATVTPLHARTRWFGIPLRAAAALLVVVGGALVWRAVTPSGVARRETPRPYTFVAGVGVVDSLRLPDGTGVVLGPGSRLDLSAGYGTQTRIVSLRGQAMFDVVHDAGHPFVVQAGRALLRDVGTSFAVESDQSGAVRVAIKEGVVGLMLGGGQAAREDTLRAGDRAEVSAAGLVTVARGTASAEDLAWLERRLVFRDASLAQVAGDLRRWYGLELRIGDPALAARHLTATFDRDTRSDVGRLVAAALGATAVQSGDTIWLGPTAGAARR